MLRLRDPRFAARAVAAFTGAAAGSGLVVALHADGGTPVATVVTSDGPTALAMTAAQAQTLAHGADVDYVAHAPARATYAQAPLDPAASTVELHTVTRLRVTGAVRRRCSRC